jgi:hypothetical protein
MLGVQLGGGPLDLDERDELLVDAHAVVGKLALDRVLGGQVGVLVVAERLAEEVGHQ